MWYRTRKEKSSLHRGTSLGQNWMRLVGYVSVRLWHWWAGITQWKKLVRGSLE